MNSHGFLFACLASLLWLSSGCSGLPVHTQAPRVSLIGVSLVSMELLEQRYQVNLRIKNPNAFVLPVRGIDFYLELNGQTFADGVSNRALDVPAYGESVLALEVSSSLLHLFRQLQSLDEDPASGVSYRIKGTVAIGATGRRLPFQYSGEIRAPVDSSPGQPRKIRQDS